MKKSKVIIPALGVLILSTAASVTGTVAWFTANRSYTMTAGDFAVVNTKENLICELSNGLGVTADDENKQVTIASTGVGSHQLTDASVDIDNKPSSDVLAPSVVVPDADGLLVDKYITYSSATDDSNASTGLIRSGSIYSAFMWDMEFKLSFSSTANKKVGLFLDLTDSKSYVRVKEITTEAKTVEANTYYTDPDCAVGHAVAAGSMAAGTYYRKTTNNTGQGFRIAFVPKIIPANCLGLTKVWGDLQTKANMKYINNGAHDNTLASKEVALSTATKTAQLVNGVWSEATVGTGMMAMDSADTTAVPSSGDLTTTTALASNSNYLGFFYPSQSQTVSLKFTCIAYYEGTDPKIVNNSDTVYETVTSQMEFGLYDLEALA